jgi:hypothetical protein
MQAQRAFCSYVDLLINDARMNIDTDFAAWQEGLNSRDAPFPRQTLNGKFSIWLASNLEIKMSTVEL